MPRTRTFLERSLTRHQRVLYEQKFLRYRYTAFARPFTYVAVLSPPAGVIGKNENVRTDTLAKLVSLGLLQTEDVRTPKGIHSGTRWSLKVANAQTPNSPGSASSANAG